MHLLSSTTSPYLQSSKTRFRVMYQVLCGMGSLRQMEALSPIALSEPDASSSSVPSILLHCLSHRIYTLMECVTHLLIWKKNSQGPLLMPRNIPCTTFHLTAATSHASELSTMKLITLESTSWRETTVSSSSLHVDKCLTLSLLTTCRHTPLI